jgi:type II secretory pathway pseudopilin PulG
MKLSIKRPAEPLFFCRKGFSLIEVVLAIGIFLVTVLALVGLLGPTLQSVDEVEKVDETVSVVSTVNAFLQSSPDINPGGSKFNAIYNAVTSGDHATIFVYRYYDDQTGSDERIDIAVGFAPGESGVNDRAIVNQDFGFGKAAGPIYRVVLSASSVTPESHRSGTRNSDNIFTLSKSLAAYPEGYLAMEVRIFSEDPPGPNRTFNTSANLADLSLIEPIFTYNTAIVR